MSKPRIVKDYDQLSDAVKEQLKIVYPRGFSQHLVRFVNKKGEKKLGLPFETEEVYYLIRMSADKADRIVYEDEDFNEDGILKKKAKEGYEEKYDDIDYLSYNANEDNDFDTSEDDDEDDL